MPSCLFVCYSVRLLVFPWTIELSSQVLVRAAELRAIHVSVITWYYTCRYRYRSIMRFHQKSHDAGGQNNYSSPNISRRFATSAPMQTFTVVSDKLIRVTHPIKVTVSVVKYRLQSWECSCYVFCEHGHDKNFLCWHMNSPWSQLHVSFDTVCCWRSVQTTVPVRQKAVTTSTKRKTNLTTKMMMTTCLRRQSWITITTPDIIIIIIIIIIMRLVLLVVALAASAAKVRWQDLPASVVNVPCLWRTSSRKYSTQCELFVLSVRVGT